MHDNVRNLELGPRGLIIQARLGFYVFPSLCCFMFFPWCSVLSQEEATVYLFPSNLFPATRLFPSQRFEPLASWATCPLFLTEAFQDKNPFFLGWAPRSDPSG